MLEAYSHTRVERPDANLLVRARLVAELGLLTHPDGGAGPQGRRCRRGAHHAAAPARRRRAPAQRGARRLPAHLARAGRAAPPHRAAARPGRRRRRRGPARGGRRVERGPGGRRGRPPTAADDRRRTPRHAEPACRTRTHAAEDAGEVDAAEATDGTTRERRAEDDERPEPSAGPERSVDEADQVTTEIDLRDERPPARGDLLGTRQLGPERLAGGRVEERAAHPVLGHAAHPRPREPVGRRAAARGPPPAPRSAGAPVFQSTTTQPGSPSAATSSNTASIRPRTAMPSTTVSTLVSTSTGVRSAHSLARKRRSQGAQVGVAGVVVGRPGQLVDVDEGRPRVVLLDPGVERRAPPGGQRGRGRHRPAQVEGEPLGVLGERDERRGRQVRGQRDVDAAPGAPPGPLVEQHPDLARPSGRAAAAPRQRDAGGRHRHRRGTAPSRLEQRARGGRRGRASARRRSPPRRCAGSAAWGRRPAAGRPTARARDRAPDVPHLLEEAGGDPRRGRGAPDVRGEQQVGAGPGDRDVGEPALLGDAVVGHRRAEALVLAGEASQPVCRRPRRTGAGPRGRRAGRRAGSASPASQPLSLGSAWPTPRRATSVRLPEWAGNDALDQPGHGDDVPLQALGRVHGHDLHGVGAGLDPAQVEPALLVDGGVEPGEEAAQRRPVGAGGEGGGDVGEGVEVGPRRARRSARAGPAPRCRARARPRPRRPARPGRAR